MGTLRPRKNSQAPRIWRGRGVIMRLEPFSIRTRSSEPVRAAVDAGRELVGESAAFRYMRFRLEQVAPTDATILLLGETGTGKGLAAQLVHQLGRRRDARFISVDCSSLPATLVESELFGREKG